MINKPAELARLAIVAQEYADGLTVTQAARLLHVRPTKVKEAVERGDLKEVSYPYHKRRRINRASLVAYVERVSASNDKRVLA